MKPARKKYYRRLCLSLMLMAVAALVAWLMAGDAMRWELCFVIWCVVSIILFFSVGPGMTLGRIYGIEDARKKRIIRENIEAWNRMNRKFCKKFDREMEREINRNRHYGSDSSSATGWSSVGADCGDGSGDCC